MNLKVIHAQPRISPSPQNNKHIDHNPPPLLWPAAKGIRIQYAIRLSQNPRFPKRSTIAEEGLPWAMFNPHQKLAAGTWHWQYGTSKNGRPYRWSNTFTFEITRSAKQMHTPPASDIINACPKEHPRLWALPNQNFTLLKRHAKQFTSHANPYLNAPLPNDTMPPDKGDDEYQIFKFHRWGSKALAGGMTQSVQWLIPAYLLSGDERYAREAIRRGLHVANWDPDGYTNPIISDFADGSCMRLLAGVYDTFYDQLSKSERQSIRTALITRAERIFNEETNKIETLVFRSHFWQHLLIEFSEAAFALLHEHPKATQWLRFVYELWVARFPLMGGADGGWANGNAYFGTNIETLLVLPTRFQTLTGVNLFQSPWYKNSADFLFYTWPPHSRSNGFGDGTELKAHPTSNHIAFVLDMAIRFKNPYAAWYIQQWQPKVGKSIDPLLLWHQINTDKSPKPRARAPKTLSQAKCFPDVGITSLHTDLANPTQNLMVSMRSSPYGSLLHSHEDQNSVNIFYGGEPLFRNSGYYTSAGDPHSKTWYRATRGHNNILINGKGQPRSSESYGLTLRFLNGKHIAYALGDASNAYGDTGLTHYRRHLVLLRPNVLIIYDDLQADHNANWQWLLHGDRKITASVRHQRLRTQTKTARSQVNIYGTYPSTIDINTAFDPPAVNWGGNKTLLGKNMDVFPDQYHVTLSPKTACNTMRFLTIFQIDDRKNKTSFQDPTQNEGCIQLNNWSIMANLNVDQKPSLAIHHQNKRIALAIDCPSVTVGKKRYRSSNTTTLIESSNIQRSKDTLPQAAR